MGRNVTALGNEKKEKKELKKHAATIHCSNTLSLLQRKITNALLFHAYKDLMVREEHIITVKQLCRLIGYHGNNHAAIREAFRGLMTTLIEWNLTEDVKGMENWTASSIIASVSLQGPLCYYAYSPRMKQLLYSPSMFGKVDLVIQSRFRSSYGLALYENCIRYRGLPQTKWFDMSLFKKLMGVPSGKYDIFRDFKRRVLDKAIDEVNTYSDLFITPDLVKEGRKVVKIRFKLKDRAKRTRLGQEALMQVAKEKEAGDALQASLIQDFGLTHEQVSAAFAKYESGFIQEKMLLILASASYQSGKIDNVAAYLLSALKYDYQPTKAKPLLTVVKDEPSLEEMKKSVESIRALYQSYREKILHDAIDNLGEVQKAQFMAAFCEFAQATIANVLYLQHNKYTRENVHESPQIKALLRQFALREFDFLNIDSLETFVATLPHEKITAWQQFKALDPDHPLLRFSE